MKPNIRFFAAILLVGLTSAVPLAEFVDTFQHDVPSHEPSEGGVSSATLIRALVSAFLVLLGGVFAGLTIGLMGQDEVHLQVVAQSGEEHEKRAALKVLKLLSRGKHWVLVTLLLGNVITNETLPIVLDRLLGGGWYAVASSTVAIVIFGEVIPQSISVRYGLTLGAFFAPFVLVLMYVMAPAAYPIALLLDYLLGKSHGTVYKKAGLKSLVTLHRTMGVEPLNEDEVTIISAVLDLKDKPVSSIMTPIKDVFVLSADTILNEEMVERIFLTGFNRIPIHAPGQPGNFIGMLLVRILITYDPEDCMPVSSFVLATLPETHPDTSCLNILNYFQEGNSHMVAVSTSPGAITGVIGVLTLEDVIEELIGEEIVDESDVYINVHKAIRRRTPGPFKDYKGLISGTGISKLIPSNRAANPHATSNSKITIKRSQANEMTPLLDSDAVVNQATSSMPQVRASERAVLAPRRPGHLQVAGSHSPRSKHSPVSSLLSQTPSRPTYIENVMRVEGFNKVVIAEVSSDSESSYSRANTPF